MKITPLLTFLSLTLGHATALLTKQKGNVTLSYKTNDSLRLVDDPYEIDPNEEEESGQMIVDRPREEGEIGPIGHDYGGNIGVGPSSGVQCLVKRPLGDDALNYCKYVSPEDQMQRLKAALNLVVLTWNGVGSDAHKRLLRSASVFKYDIQALGEEGTYLEPSDQLKLLREAVEKLKEEKKSKLVLFINGPDAILTSGPLRVVEGLDDSEAELLISSTGIFKGDKELRDQFPSVQRGKRFGSAGAFVGNIETVNSLLKAFPDETDLQDLLARAYTKESFRKKFKIEIDHTSNVFQNLNGATSDLELNFVGKEAYIQNSQYKTVPAVVRADNKTKTILNSYGSYLARSWNSEDGCRECWEDMNSLEDTADDDLPVVTLAIFIERPTPFLDEFFATLDAFLYPREKMHLFIHNGVDIHKEVIDNWVEKVKNDFKTSTYHTFEDPSMKEWHAKNAAIDYCLEKDCSYIFYIDGDARIDNPYALKLLIEQNRPVVAPMLPRPGKAWSNFWGALTADGFYARSEDYMEIIQNEKRGLWNVPYISSSFLLKRSLLENPKTKPAFIYNLLDPDMAFSQNLRNQGVFMYVSNRVDLGHLVNSENFNYNNLYPELWQMFDNRWDWEKRYLHVNYSQSLNETNKILMPCPDVYWFPVFTERYAKEMIEVMENFGQWSDGSHMDKRLEGGYETVPTVDIHMNQVNYNDEWHEILRAYVQPLQLRVYDGYYNDPPRALMSFTVRYKPDEQPFLRPHHDTSTYTINVGLNRPHIDFQGGGCRFVRYNCSVVDTRVGWMLMHPGRLTHLHEGLRVTGGTRYIIVTFVDP